MPGNNNSVNPIRLLRATFSDASKRELQKYCTQRAFAALVGRSESLIRNIEAGLVDCSQKLAVAISAKTGVSAEWLLEGGASGERIPSEDGGDWTPEMVLSRIARLNRMEIGNTVQAEASLRNVSPAELLLRMTQVLLIHAAEDRAAQFPDALSKLLRDFKMFPPNTMEGEQSEAWKQFDRILPRRDVESQLGRISIPRDSDS